MEGDAVEGEGAQAHVGLALADLEPGRAAADEEGLGRAVERCVDEHPLRARGTRDVALGAFQDVAVPAPTGPRLQARGIEIEPRLVREANGNAVKARVADRVWFVTQDLFETDLGPATVVTLYLLPRLNQQLMPKLKRLRPGTRIVSHYYDMGPEWPPDQSQDINSLMIYLWTIK